MKKTILGLMALLLVGVVAVGAFAMPFGNQNSNEEKQGFGMRGGMFGNEAMRDALDSGDYQDYLDAFEESDRQFLATKMTEEQFNERRSNYQEREERMTEREANREATETAIEAGDYSAWLTAISESNSPMTEELTQTITVENFGTFAEMHTAMENHDFETAKELADELGLERPGKGNFMGKGLNGEGFSMGDGSSKGRMSGAGRGRSLERPCVE